MVLNTDPNCLKNIDYRKNDFHLIANLHKPTEIDLSTGFPTEHIFYVTAFHIHDDLNKEALRNALLI